MGGGSSAFAGLAMPHFWMVAPEMRSLVCNSLSSCALMRGHLSEYPVYLHKQDSMLESSGRHRKQSGHNTMWKTLSYKSTLQSGSFWRGNTHSYIQSRKYLENRGERPTLRSKERNYKCFPCHCLHSLMFLCSGLNFINE